MEMRTMRERIGVAITGAIDPHDGYAATSTEDLVDAVLDAMRMPCPRMIAAALPLISQPTQEHRATGKAALALLPPVRVEQHFQGEQAAADLARDWETMIDAARRGG